MSEQKRSAESILGNMDTNLEVDTGISILYPPGHNITGWIEIRLVSQNSPTKIVKQKWFNLSINEEDRLDVAKAIGEYVRSEQKGSDGILYNAYIGRSLRTKEGGSTERDVKWLQAVVIDVDPIRTDKEHPASGEECNLSTEVARKLGNNSGCNYSILQSGNGAQLWMSLREPTDIRGRADFIAKAQSDLATSLCSSASLSGVRLDSIYDAPRLVKCPGSISYKGRATGDRPYRECRFSESRSGLQDISLDGYIGDLVNEKETIRVVSNIRMVPVPNKFWIDVNRDNRLREAWLGTKVGLSKNPDESSSEQDMSLAGMLKHRGYTREEAAAILRSTLRDKAKERADYLSLTLGKVYGSSV